MLCFTWHILCNLPLDTSTPKNLEAFFKAVMRPSFNEHIYSDRLILFINDASYLLITYGDNHNYIIETSVDKLINLSIGLYVGESTEDD